MQLALARLVIVLGYDVGLGLALSLALWAGGAAQVLALTLSWLMPLLLVAGLALLLSLRLSIQAAASVAYGSWLAVLAINVTTNLQLLPLTPLSESLLGGIGVALLAIALLRLQPGMHRLLPTPISDREPFRGLARDRGVRASASARAHACRLHT